MSISTDQHVFICRETWPRLVADDAEHNEQAAATRARIAAEAEREAQALGLPSVRILAPCGATLDAFPVRLPAVVDGAAEAASPRARVMPGVKEGSWLEFPSTSVPFAPGDGHGWRAARVLSRKDATVADARRRLVDELASVALNDAKAAAMVRRAAADYRAHGDRDRFGGALAAGPVARAVKLLNDYRAANREAPVDLARALAGEAAAVAP